MSVSEEWFRAARADGLPNALVLNTSLWSHISDATTSQIYRSIVNRVRRGLPVNPIVFRCDTATHRRTMRLTVSAGADGHVIFSSAIERAELRPPLPLLQPDVERTSDHIVMCGWCMRILAAKMWMEIDEAVNHRRLFEHPPLPLLTHAICPQCETRYFAGA